MYNLKKSLSLLDDLIKEVNKGDVERKIREIDALECDGPTLEEYLETFESHYQFFYSNLENALPLAIDLSSYNEVIGLDKIRDKVNLHCLTINEFISEVSVEFAPTETFDFCAA